MKPAACFILLLASLALAGCGEVVLPWSDTADQEEPAVVTRPSVRATAEFPEIQEARLRQLALLEPADLPRGFELQYEDMEELEGAALYSATYYKEISSEEELVEVSESHAPVYVNLLILLADDEGFLTFFYEALKAVPPDAMEQYLGIEEHSLVQGPGVEQLGARVVPVSFRQFGEDSYGWQTWYTIRESDTHAEFSLVELGVCMRRGRSLGIVTAIAAEGPPPTASLEELAAKLDERLAIGLP